ncbi:MAG: hypothetical protein CMK32_09050 [Porticoccaceae bacterium]|nr:hypothetical protein [Porticoccaceae bacterium]
MTVLSQEDKLAITDVLNRYVHHVDSNEADEWLALFTEDGAFDIPGLMRLEGRDQLRTMVATVAEQGGGKWRHQITNVVVDAGETAGLARVRAYGLVTDWNQGGQPIAFTDYRIKMRNQGGWKIHELIAGPVAIPGQ